MLGLLMTWAARTSLAGDPFSEGTGDIPLTLAYVAAGTVLALLLRRLSAERLERLAGLLVVVSLAILAAADRHLIGFESGARAWLRIGDFVIEPAEVVALAVVVFAAKQLATARFSRKLAFDPTILLFLSGIPFLLLTFDATLGTTVVVAGVLITLLLVAGARIGNLVLGTVPLLLAFALLLLVEPYRSERALSFFHPWKDFFGSGFQIAQSLITVGSGGLLGHGFGNSIQRASYLPEAEGNFVLAIMAEEFGLIAILGVLALILLIAYAGLKNALRAEDRYRTLLVTGLTALLITPAIVNVFMVLGMAPPVRVGLPFVSYGMTGSLAAFAAVGILVSAMLWAPAPAETKGGHPRGLTNRLNKRRVGLVFAVVLALVTVAALRGTWLDTVRAGDLQAQAAAQQTVVEVEPGLRGTIVDRHGFPLAVSRPAFDVAATPYAIYDPDLAMRKLPGLLDISRAQLRHLLDTESGFVYLAHGIPAAAGEAVRRLEIGGIELIATQIRNHPRGPIASQTVGGIGDEGEGLFGIELGFDRELSGEDGVRRTITDANGYPLSRQKPAPAVSGESLGVTLDAGLQGKVEEVLAATGERSGAIHAVAIVTDPRSGKILADATWPSFDTGRLDSTAPEQLIDRSIGFEYTPGAIVDPLSIAVALAERRVTLASTFPTPAEIHIADRVIEAEPGAGGSATVAQLLRSPDDVGTVEVALRLAPADFARWTGRFGFGRPTRIGLPGERSGSIPGGATSAATTASLAVGHSQMVTPMQLAVAYSALADRGVLHRPQIVRSVGGDAVDRPAGVRILPRLSAEEILENLGEDGRLSAIAPIVDSRSGKYSRDAHDLTAVRLIPSRRPKLVEVLVLDRLPGLDPNPALAASSLEEINRFALPYLGIPGD
jgi:cell division protein FtsW (lipid II flippase)/cell division protein FtsI/penicillin-binding protein 2